MSTSELVLVLFSPTNILLVKNDARDLIQKILPAQRIVKIGATRAVQHNVKQVARLRNSQVGVTIIRHFF